MFENCSALKTSKFHVAWNAIPFPGHGRRRHIRLKIRRRVAELIIVYAPAIGRFDPLEIIPFVAVIEYREPPSVINYIFDNAGVNVLRIPDRREVNSPTFYGS